ncbi:MAG: hypothetical protein V1701_02840 [Planctomycetota bacterium]
MLLYMEINDSILSLSGNPYRGHQDEEADEQVASMDRGNILYYKREKRQQYEYHGHEPFHI